MSDSLIYNGYDEMLVSNSSFFRFCFIKCVALSTSSPQLTASCEHGRSAVVTLRCNPEKGERGDLTVPRCVCVLNFFY